MISSTVVTPLAAYAITLFYRVPPLRTRSALEEKNELALAEQEGAEV